jgi:endoglucanase
VPWHRALRASIPLLVGVTTLGALIGAPLLRHSGGLVADAGAAGAGAPVVRHGDGFERAASGPQGVSGWRASRGRPRLARNVSAHGRASLRTPRRAGSHWVLRRLARHPVARGTVRLSFRRTRGGHHSLLRLRGAGLHLRDLGDGRIELRRDGRRVAIARGAHGSPYWNRVALAFDAKRSRARLSLNGSPGRWRPVSGLAPARSLELGTRNGRNGPVWFDAVAWQAVPTVPRPPQVRSASRADPSLAVAVAGNRLVDGAGRPIRLRGVNRPGLEWACSQGLGLVDGPLDGAALDVIDSWGGNALRVPLNARCWLGSGLEDGAAGGEAYRAYVDDLVRRLIARGRYVILDLHWSGPTGSAPAARQMADAEHAIPFWTSLATRYRDVSGVLFDLYNEPHGITWRCWRDGCDMPGGWRAAGMQEMLDAVRSAGARQPVIASGLEWANDLSQWPAWRPDDPLGQLAAGFHAYNFNRCRDATCWDATVGPVAERVPVLITELGTDRCDAAFPDALMDWADRRGISYLPWGWFVADCRGFPSLIADWRGTPTGYGEAVRRRLSRD